MPRCHSISLGCPKNRVDAERLLGMPGLAPSMVEDPADADFIFINTCGFIRPAVEESIRVIAQTIEDISAACPRPLLVVGGCLVGRYGIKDLAAGLPEVDVWLDNRELALWPHKLAAALGLPAPEHDPTMHAVADNRILSVNRLLSTGPSYAWLKVSDGCRHACSFCTIPSIRGAYHSQPVAPLVAEAKGLLSQGVRELVLVAQDLTAWGHDLDTPQDLRHLLDALLPLDGLARMRLMYMYPTGLSRELLTYLRDACTAGSPFVPYFDVPLQHAHPDILSRMGRPFARNPREVVDRIRDIFSDAVLRTSLIVGFPGETETHFSALHDFVQDVRFNHLGVFAYEAEDGTPAATMPDQVDEALKQERRDAIMRTQAEISSEWLEGFTGQRLPILVDAPHDEWPGLHTGRAWFQAPDIDGIVYVSGPGVTPGAIVEAEIVETREYDLIALA